MITFAVAFLLQVPQQVTRADSLAADSVRARRAQQLEGVQVTIIRGRAAPISEKTIDRADIQRRYTGQETPILLQSAPGITAYSESGSASNYSYIRLRGIDQSRINITLDGIPLNEPEDEALYFSNFPDFSNSIASVQVQRGVGSSTHGTASYAGSVNFESVPIASVPAGGELQLTSGSYNTVRASAVYQTGMLASGVAGYVRGSAQHTDGYRYNSGNRSRSLFASGGWFGATDIVKVSLLAGLSSNEQAYYASALTVLRTSPRDNPFGNAREQAVDDRFHQDLLSVAWTHALSPSASIATTAYGFDAGGWYDYPGDHGNSDAYHYLLHSRWGGVISALDWSGHSSSASVGINVARYAREHWLTQRPDLVTRDYDNTGYKGEQSAFAKGSITAGGATFSGDLQARLVQFRYQPTAGTAVAPASVNWSFLNPKVGVSAPLRDGLAAYASVGMNGREPTRGDMFAGADDLDPSTLPLTRVRAETAYDLETGITWHRSNIRAQANLFLMQFHNEIAAIGAISELGYDLRKNVDHSMRRGFEGDVTWQAASALAFVGNVSVTDARISDYRDDVSGLTYHDVTPLMTPKLVSNHGVRSELAPWLLLDVDGRYVSRMMLTNTNDPRSVVPESWFADAGATFRFAGQSALVQVRNLFDRRVYTGGYPGQLTGSSDANAVEPYYFLLAPRNVSVNVKVAF
ncbi:MAG: TonB-dependent receptor [Gemmatimonadetes bacterium]|nr:TonB-dependent receptor [Gemmatimonadota bacterium]